MSILLLQTTLQMALLEKNESEYVLLLREAKSLLEKTHKAFSVISAGSGVSLEKISRIHQGFQRDVTKTNLRSVISFFKRHPEYTDESAGLTLKVPLKHGHIKDSKEIVEKKLKMMQSIISECELINRKIYLVCLDTGVSQGTSSYIRRGVTNMVSITTLERIQAALDLYRSQNK